MVAPIQTKYKDRIYDMPKCKIVHNPVFTHYFICNDKWVPLVEKGATNPQDQKILVFTSRSQATEFALLCDAVQDFLIIGLTNDTWNVFKQSEKYVIISEPLDNEDK